MRRLAACHSASLPRSICASASSAVVGAGYCPLTVNRSVFTSSGSYWADTALKWAERSGSVRLYIGAESSVSSALGMALSRLRAESCTIAALNEVTA